MATRQEDFLQHLRETFRLEAAEHFSALSTGLILLEQATDEDRRADVIENLYREAHSLKGAARSVNLTAVESACHSLETTLAALKDGSLQPAAEVLDELHRDIRRAEELVSKEMKCDVSSRATAGGRDVKGAEPVAPAGRAEPVELSASVDDRPTVGERRSGEPVAPRSTGGGETRARLRTRRVPEALHDPETLRDPETSRSHGTVRVSAERVELLQEHTDELLALAFGAERRAEELSELAATVAGWRRGCEELRQELSRPKHSSGRATADHEDGASELLERLSSETTLIERRTDRLATDVEADCRQLRRVGGELQDAVRLTLMLPFSYLTDALPATAREILRSQGKEADLAFQGTELEMDRRVLQQLKDPLLHLIRNAIDHGVEKPADRVRSGKPPRAAISVTADRIGGGSLEVRVSDDGVGLDRDRLRESAIGRGVVGREEAAELTDDETINLAFQSGVTTSPIITDISGRGLGLAIVREKVEGIGGTVRAESRHGSGTTFRLVLPVKLSVLTGVFVSVGDHVFVVPHVHVIRALSYNPADVRTVANRNVVTIDGISCLVVRLARVLGIPEKSRPDPEPLRAFGLLLRAGDTEALFAVDRVVESREVIVKRLGPQLQRVKHVTGAAIRGTGEVVPVLNVFGLVESAAADRSFDVPVPRATEESSELQKCILVVEDSFTARALIKNILEGEGYAVVTAADGVEGYVAVHERQFDLVVSDVDMPRMNGFDLTAKIRGDAAVAALPVVLVTALESPRDKERGIEVGANAYLVKSSFEQSNLLEVIGRLI